MKSKFIKQVSVKEALKMGPIKFVKDYLFPAMEREHGNGFAMDTWRQKIHVIDGDSDKVRFDDVFRKVPACKSVMCIGGTMEAIVGTRNLDKLGAILGIDSDYVGTLFYDWDVRGGWSDKFLEAFRDAKTPLQKVRAAKGQVLEAIKTKGACFYREYQKTEL